jgi:hypothetical protein
VGCDGVGEEGTQKAKGGSRKHHQLTPDDEHDTNRDDCSGSSMHVGRCMAMTMRRKPRCRDASQAV